MISSASCAYVMCSAWKRMAIAEESGRLRASSACTGAIAGRYGVYGVTALTGSRRSGVVGESALSGALFSASSSSKNQV